MVPNSTKKTKILYIITKSNWGGAGRYVYDITTRMPKNDYDVIVALGGNGKLKTKLENVGIRTILINKLARDINIFVDITVFFNLIKLFKKERPDIIHLNSSKIGGIGALAGRLTGVRKIIFTAHGWAWGEERNSIEKIVIKILSWFTILLVHNTITVSEYDGEIAKKLPFVSKKITTIHNGISEINFIYKSKARKILLNKQKIKLHNETIWIGTIGELHKNKGFDYAIKEFSLLKKKSLKFVFVIIGKGEERRRLQNLIERYQLEKNIFIVIYDEKAAKLLKAFDVFLLPSKKEGLPYVLLEAGMANIPVIATSVGGIPEIIDNLKSGILITQNKTNSIVESINYMTTHKEESKLFSQKLYRKVIEKFSTYKMFKNTMKIYVS